MNKTIKEKLKINKLKYRQKDKPKFKDLVSQFNKWWKSEVK